MQPLAAYMNKMPMKVRDTQYWMFDPDWSYLSATGADFAIAYKSDVNSGMFSSFVPNIKPESIYELPGNIIAFPIRKTNPLTGSDGIAFDNGFFQLAPTAASQGNASAPGDTKIVDAPILGTLSSSSIRVTDFSSNFGNYIRLNFDASVPTNVRYLFFGNPRLHFYVNGTETTPLLLNGAETIQVPAGKTTIEVKYIFRALTFFWLISAAFWLACLVSFFYEAYLFLRSRRGPRAVFNS